MSFVAAWGNITHLAQDGQSGPSKRQASLKNLTTGVRDNAVAAPFYSHRSLSPVVDVACGDAATVVLDADGGCVAFVAHGDRRVRRLMNTRVSQAAVGGESALLVASTGALLQFDARTWEKPRAVRLQFEVAAVACGARHCLVATRCGALFSWGEATAGQLGISDDPDQLKKPRTEPCRVALRALASQERDAVACGAHHSAAVTTNGDLWTWGWSEHGRLGRPSGSVCQSGSVAEGEEDEDGRPSGLPQRVEFVEGSSNVFVRAVACGSCHTLALSTRGEVYGCGWNEYGQACGRGPAAVATPTRVCLEKRKRSNQQPQPSSFNAVLVAAGFAHSLAVNASGVACAWGFGEDGQLGGGSEQSSFTPVEVATVRKFAFASIAAGGTHSVAVGTPYDMGSLREKIAERRRQSEARTTAATRLQAQARRAAVAFRKRRDEALASRLEAATQDAVRSEDPMLVQKELATYRAHVWRWAKPVLERVAAEVARRLETRRALAAATDAGVDASLRAPTISRRISDLSATIVFVRTVLDKDVDAEASLGWQDHRWRESFAPLKRAAAARDDLQRQVEACAATTISKRERGRRARAISRPKLAAGRRLTAFVAAVNAVRRARLEFRAMQARERDRQKRRNEASYRVTKFFRRVVAHRRVERKRVTQSRRRELERRARGDAAVVLQKAARRRAALRVRRRLQRRADVHRRREEEEEAQRRSEQSARLCKLREERERRNSIDARHAREAAREAARHLRDRAKKDADAAARAASTAAEALQRAKRDRDRDRRARAAAERRRSRDSLDEPPVPPSDDNLMSVDGEVDTGPELDDSDPSSANEATTFPEYVEILKAVPRRHLFEETGEVDYTTPVVPQHRKKPRFKTVEKWGELLLANNDG
ncbi:hypothetical protein CTAYLR_008578 [Chrysophaeum taylorii]|uniref:RCC1-like domain-containing protein n=1 Tax=Chrysophaeum taylorii TaxID=2483200 RepID=A0AAD7UF06_9STRA|nr:hypothetical protein CTAYLR_008578 [Chrysophaeum taylorii]